jgi:glycine cleavage system T protein
MNWTGASVEPKKDDFLIRENIAKIDQFTERLIRLEEERQARKLIMIASESIAPLPVREALSSCFTNLYAEGYPWLRMYMKTEEELKDFSTELAYLRRYADRRYYKGVDYADFVEALARRRCAEAFAANGVSADKIYANVQSLSGAAANNAVYEAFLKTGDVVMGLDLTHGGHLTHGSEVNRSGMTYKIVAYKTSPATGLLDYAAIKKLALEAKPKMIIAGYSAYPRTIDWAAFREIADSIGNGCIVLADIAHPAGLVAAGLFPNPVGLADVVSFTTHKTLCGPRGACILTTDEEKGQMIDTAVFPGEQGGPHINTIAAKAVAFLIAKTQKFKDLMKGVMENAKAITEAFRKRNMKIAYGGTESHMMLVDLRGIKSDTGYTMRAEVASRLLDMCGLTCNKNTIAGDTNAAYPSGLRFGTTWATQRGLGPQHMDRIADVVTNLLVNIKPFEYRGLTNVLGRGKVDMKILEETRRRVAEIVGEAAIDIEPKQRGGYPYFTAVEVNAGGASALAERHAKAGAKMIERAGWKVPASFGDVTKEVDVAKKGAAVFDATDYGLIEICGERAVQFLQGVSTANIYALKPGTAALAFLFDADNKLIDDVAIFRFPADECGCDKFIVRTSPENHDRVLAWLRAMSDGYVIFDRGDILGKIEGPVTVEDLRVCEGNEKRLVGLVLTGARGLDVLGKLSAEAKKMEFVEFRRIKMAGVGVIAGKFPCDITGLHVTLFVHPDDVAALWSAAVEAGAAPAGAEAFGKLRAEGGMPSHGAGARPDAASLYKSHPQWFDLSKFHFIGEKQVAVAVKPPVKSEKFRWAEKEAPIKKTPLNAEHHKLTKKAFMIPFAGWEMPVWYTSVSDEHATVRTAAGLFDVSHMGCLGFEGEYAARFLDIMITNYVHWLSPGQSQYGQILDCDGRVIDDCMVYQRARNKYLMVVNASNEDKVKAYFRGVIAGKYLLDCDNPLKKLEGEFTFRDLKDPKEGDHRKIDIALQGPNSLKILQTLTDDAELKDNLGRVRRTDLIEGKFGRFDLMISRTGYCGEDYGYEIFVHPDQSVELWRTLLEKGRQYGIKPTGLGSRDSTRTEAGLPLYGHELAGPYNINPIAAGYAGYVKFHKPFFVGRKPLLEDEKTRTMEIVRFRMNEKGVKTVHNGDPVVNRKGQFIGTVTSAALVEGIQVGMAYIDRKYIAPGTPVGIFPMPHDEKGDWSEKSKDNLAAGDKLYLNEWAQVITRFPRKPTPGMPQALRDTLASE